MKKVLRVLRNLIILATLVAAIVTIGVLYYMEYMLPDINALNNVQLQVPLQIYTKDGKLIAEYGEKRRMPIPYDQIPKQLINAVLATEDQRYFQHPGIDIPGLMRAAVKLVLTGRKDEGGSTITMQVARSFYLNRHKTFGRKLREILLALKIDHKLSKEKILELYLNKIFLGARAYGVEAAAQVYFGKSLSQLSLDQYAMLAGLPKAPSALNPITNLEAAKKRRDHVLGRMLELNYITDKEYKEAIKTPLVASYHELQNQVKAPYVAELVRQQLEQMYGDTTYTDGFSVYTTVDSKLQNIANHSVRDALLDYDQRHGYRGPEKNLGTPDLKRMQQIEKILKSVATINTLEPGVVVETTPTTVTVEKSDGEFVTIPWDGLSWARRQINADYLGRVPRTTRDIVRLGDLIRVHKDSDGEWHLGQLPRAEAGLISLNPQNGGILAMVGGFDFASSKFNRITNAQRQPGSSFKPFIYSAALDKGYTFATVINDAPIVIENPIDNSLWRPHNDNKKFYGPTRLHEALIHSRNMVSIRLLDLITLPYAINYLKRFGFSPTQLPPGLSLALGTANVTPLQMASAYSVFANGGYQVTPYVIAYIKDCHGKVIYQAKPLVACKTCNAKDPTAAPSVVSAQNVYLITSVLRDVIQHGTATKAKSLERNDLAGKTGTTNNQNDAWFAGFNPDIVTISWVGFDQPQSLHEFGAQAALPMWIEFMGAALKGTPEHTFEQPPGIVTAKIDPLSGRRVADNEPNAITEYFMTPYVPEEDVYNPVQNNLVAEEQPKSDSDPNQVDNYRNRYNRYNSYGRRYNGGYDRRYNRNDYDDDYRRDYSRSRGGYDNDYYNSPGGYYDNGY